MSGWSSNDAKDFLDVVKTVANKTFDSKNNILKTALAVVIDASDSINPTIRLLNSPDDGSQDFGVLNMSGESLANGDSVWLNYWDGYTNAYIAVKNGTFSARGHVDSHKTGGTDALLATDIDAMPESAISSNLLINGGFDIWQRGTSQTASGYGSDDRWGNSFSNSVKTHSQQTFIVGQTDVDGNPKYYSRSVVTTSNSASALNVKYQNIEDVTRFSGVTLTASFWAKADADKNISIEFLQQFGVGGSASVTGLGVTKFALTSIWQKFTATVALPSISGKTIGTSNSFQFRIWFEAGSNYAARTDSLGNQSGTFDIANVQLNFGSVALPFVPRSFADELGLCQRYYLPDCVRFSTGVVPNGQAHFYSKVITPSPLRATPTLSLITADAAYLSSGQVLAVSSVAQNGLFSNGFGVDATLSGNATANSIASFVNTVVNADAEL